MKVVYTITCQNRKISVEVDLTDSVNYLGSADSAQSPATSHAAAPGLHDPSEYPLRVEHRHRRRGSPVTSS